MFKQYLINLLMGLDQFISTVLGGHPDDTVSQRLGRAKLSDSDLVVDLAAGVIDALALALFDEHNHCVGSLSGRSNAKEVWNWGGSREQINVER